MASAAPTPTRQNPPTPAPPPGTTAISGERVRRNSPGPTAANEAETETAPCRTASHGRCRWRKVDSCRLSFRLARHRQVGKAPQGEAAGRLGGIDNSKFDLFKPF